MWGWAVIQGSRELPWYNGALLVAAITAAATFIFGQISAWRLSKQSARDKKMALLFAFYAEVTVIREELRMLVGEIVRELDAGKPLAFNQWTLRVLPTVVFKENAKSLGELGDSQLVQRLVRLYSRIDSNQERQSLLSETQESLSSDELARLLASQRLIQVSIFDSSIVLSSVLAELVHSPEPDANTRGKHLREDAELSKKAVQLLQQVLE